MLVLTVQLNQAGGKLPERTGCAQFAVDEPATPSLGGDLTAYEEFLAALLEDGFDRREFLTRPHEVARRTSPDEEADGFNKNGFPSPCFAGQDVESWTKLNRRCVNDSQAPNAEKSEHLEEAGTPILT